jgi:hypothetical protein
MKKSQGLSLSTVVVAALALLVLVILSFIFVGRMARVNEGQRDCVKKGGTCYDSEGGVLTCTDMGEFMILHPDGVCQKEDGRGNLIRDDEMICCIRQ